MPETTYAQDRDFLAEHTDLIELTGDGGASALVAPSWQGRVMTSSLGGNDAPAFGWLNRDFIAAGGTDETFANYGGEDRFWLGPEGGRFALWFQPGQPQDLDHWQTPAGLNETAWSVTGRNETSVTMTADFDVTNYAGRTRSVAVRRTVEMLGGDDVGALLGACLPDEVEMVGFASVNTLTNAGSEPWVPDEGLLSVWILGQFRPLPDGWVIVPIVPGPEDVLGPRAVTDYFGPLGPERCLIKPDAVLFRCDGGSRGKIGVGPRRVRPVCGSWDVGAGVLTVVSYNLPVGAHRLPYVNSLWDVESRPYAGDVVNAYNDGPPDEQTPPLGPFYELESSSPAAALAPDQALLHVHRTFHFRGPTEALDRLAIETLGVGLAEMG